MKSQIYNLTSLFLSRLETETKIEYSIRLCKIIPIIKQN